MNNILNRDKFINEKKVFHGGSSNFNKFDTKFMGTGEGAQVYGWGVYLTDSESLGEFYTRNAILNSSQREGLKNEILNWILDKKNRVYIDKQKYKPDKDGNIYGYLYAAEIPEDDGKTYIDWNTEDKEVLNEIYNNIKSSLNEEQRKFIEEELRDKKYNGINPFKKIHSIWKHHFDEIKTFSRFYWDLVHIIGSPKEASTLLNKCGYTGIKVPMNNRNDKSGKNGYNYIIFNVDDIKISTKKQIHYKAKNINRKGGSLSNDSIDKIIELPIE